MTIIDKNIIAIANTPGAGIVILIHRKDINNSETPIKCALVHGEVREVYFEDNLQRALKHIGGELEEVSTKAASDALLSNQVFRKLSDEQIGLLNSHLVG